jgi:intracellular sulfur oxidation DsrE/DsrF family protein
MEQQFSDEILNAFIDDELDNEDRERLLTAIQKDPELGRRVNDLRALRDMVKLAYSLDGAHSATQQPAGGSKLIQGVAASVILALGILLGWTLHTSPGKSIDTIARSINTGHRKGNKVVLHITTDNPDKLAVVLNETERLLKKNAHTPGKLQIAILANGKGIKLLQVSNQRFSKRLTSLSRRYSNLSLLACNETLRRLRREGRLEPLLPAARTVPSALREVFQRQRDGWTHIQI